MAKLSQVFDHDSPQAPILTGGMLLGASGVTHPPVQTIGVLTGTSSADGSFNETSGNGSIDCDTAGRKFVIESANGRIQCFVKNSSGIWTYNSKLTGVAALLGGGSLPALLAIDRSVSPNQIHVGAYDYYTATNWISVWSLANWPTLTTGNRLRQYGANNNANTAGRSLLGLGLAVDGTYAVVSSLSSPFRLLRWNHVTGVLQNEETQASQYGQFATDGSGNWWSTAQNGAAETGLWKIDPSTFTGISRLDSAFVGNMWRRSRFMNAAPLSPVYYNGRIYVRESYGRVAGWIASSGAFADDFISPGALSANGTLTGNSGHSNAMTVVQGKSGVVIDADGCGWYVAWCTNADNAAAQSFLIAWPMATTTATWTKTDWSAGVNTPLNLTAIGLNLAGEKYKIRVRKNSGSWITFNSDTLDSTAFWASVGTFTTGDTCTIELSLSTWDRLDFNSSLTATRDKLSPSNVRLILEFNDSAEGLVYVPVQTAAVKINAKPSNDGAVQIQASPVNSGAARVKVSHP